MTANDVLNAAFQRLNYTDVNGAVDTQQNAALIRRSLDAINYILLDIANIKGISVEKISQLGDEIPLEEDAALRVMPWGVGMMLAQSEGDGDNQAVMANLYNALRNSVKKEPRNIKDIIPTPAL